MATREETEGTYRLIWGWSCYEDFRTLASARQERDQMLGQPDRSWERDPLLRAPAIFMPDDDGYFVREVQ